MCEPIPKKLRLAEDSEKDESSSDTRFSPSILDIPDLPLLKILRFLDLKSLDKIEQTCRFLRKSVAEHRLHLIRRNIYHVKLFFHEEEMKNEAGFHYKESVEVRQNMGEMPKFFYFNPKEEGNQSNDRSLTDWVLSRMRNVHVNSLGIVGNIFEKVDPEKFGPNKLTARAVFLNNTFGEEKARVQKIVRFLKLLRPSALTVHEKKIEFVRHIVVEEAFLEILSTLSYFHPQADDPHSPEWALLPETELPSSFYQLPLYFMTESGIRITIESLRKALESWMMGGGVELGVWNLALPKQYNSHQKIADAVGLRYQLGSDRLIYKNFRGEEAIIFIGERDNAHVRNWNVSSRPSPKWPHARRGIWVAAGYWMFADFSNSDL